MSDQREKLIELGLEDAIVFDNPQFDSAIVGTTQDGRVVYDFDIMVRQLMEDDGSSYEDAVDFIETNTIRTIPYMGDKAPVIMFNTLEF